MNKALHEAVDLLFTRELWDTLEADPLRNCVEITVQPPRWLEDGPLGQRGRIKATLVTIAPLIEGDYTSYTETRKNLGEATFTDFPKEVIHAE